MQYDDELPCGGYENEDAKIKEEIKAISQGKECKKQDCEACECKEVKHEEQKSIHQVKNECKKCHKGRAILMHKGDPICQECLFKNMEYKCRLLLENTFKVKKDSNLLLCVSGGLNSITMVSIVVNLMKRYQKNKLFNDLACVHVQQQENLPEGYKEKFKQETGLQITVLRLEDSLEKEGGKLEDVRKLLSMFNKNANTVDLLNIMRDRLIIKYAQKNNYHFVLKGHNGEALAAETFRYFAKGLGGNIPELSPNDKQKGHFYYPLRNNLQKQIQYFYHINRLARLAIKSEEDNIDYSTTAGLDGQIKQFVDALQHMYSHTAPAIVRTAEKIQTNLKHEKPCAWCLLSQDQEKICRRCQRLWEGRKTIIEEGAFPSWMIIY